MLGLSPVNLYTASLFYRTKDEGIKFLMGRDTLDEMEWGETSVWEW